MIGLFLLFWSVFAADDLQVVGADDLPQGIHYDCASLTPPGDAAAAVIEQAHQDCINTIWCIWGDANAGTNKFKCLYDDCLKPVSSDDPKQGDCPSSLLSCTLYYVTDKHDCGTSGDPGSGDQTSYEDVYCRTGLSNIDKKPVDKCFYDDLVNRDNGGTGTCGNKPCAWKGTSSTVAPGRYCSATDAQICADVINDLPSFCNCLGSTYCNLHPKCYLKDGKCVEDLCWKGKGTSGQKCELVPDNQPTDDCGNRFERRLDASGEIIGETWYCANLKNNNSNTCFYGLDTTVDAWQTKDGKKWPDCQTVTSVNKCTQIPVYDYKSYPGTASQTTKCEIATIPSGWFAGSQICIDPGRAVPPINASMKTSLPSLFTILLAAFFATFVL